MLEIVEEIGGTVKRLGTHAVEITPPQTFSGELPHDLVPKLRASIVLSGPILARYGRVCLPHPGGDNIGKRPIDFFVDGLQALGATVDQHPDQYIFTAPNGLQGTTFVFPTMSVTGTETMMMAAVLAKGETILKNVACEPEIVALAEYLISAGAHIEGAGTHTIRIQGSNGELLQGGTCTILPDRIEAGSFVILAAATGSHLQIEQCDPSHLEIPLHILKQMGVSFTVHQKEKTIEVHERNTENEPLKPIDLITHEYPGFPTDLQAPMTVLLTQAAGESMVRETIYDGRLFYTDLLNGMGAQISLLDPYRAIVQGVTPLIGKEVASPDIRAGIAMVIAGLIAEGSTTIQNIYQIDRGYEHIEQRLQHIGAQIKRTNE